MTTMTRRRFMEMAVALGATAAWGQPFASRSEIAWRERRDFYPEGVASGDPESDSVLLWTRRPPVNGNAVNRLSVEIAENESFSQVIATAEAPISDTSDWTCRVLAGGLKPANVYWYRFTDLHGNGSRVGRTITAPADDDTRAVRFAFISCQNANQGAQNS
jgi:alkaline phosphatase D